MDETKDGEDRSVQSSSLRPSCKKPAASPDTSADDGASTIELPDMDRNSEMTADDEDDLHTIKAKTMFKMVEELPNATADGSRKLVFLSGKQATLIANDPENIQKLLTIGFEVPKPRLVIQLSPSLFMTSKEMHAHMAEDYELPSKTAEIDRFMAEVLIPLAAQTNALVLCSGAAGAYPACGLAASLTRMMSLVSCRWGRKPPFTVMSCLGEIGGLYLNCKEDAVWRSIRSGSRTWRKRDAKLQELAVEEVRRRREQNPQFKLSGPVMDLDPSGVNFVIVDGSSEESLSPPNFKKPYNLLTSAIFQHLASEVPSITLKSGVVGFSTLDTVSYSGLEVLLDSVCSGSPVLLLDCSRRPRFEQDDADRDRGSLIQRAKDTMQADLDSIGSHAVLYASMSLAWWHLILNGSGDPGAVQDTSARSMRLRLHQAIELAQAGRLAGGPGLAAATPRQREEVLTWLGYQTRKAEHEYWLKLNGYGHSWEEQLQNQQALEAERNFAWTLRGSSLLASPLLHAINLREANSDDVKKMVNGLVKLDRLPSETPLEGLLLLRQAWDEHDIVQHLAESYKFRTKVLFFVQLALTFLIVCVATVGNDYDQSASAWGMLQDISFGLTIAASFFVSLDAFINAKAKWRQLRTYAGTLESIIWQYRCRVEPFAPDKNNPDSSLPENQLREALIAWRNEMAAGAELSASALRQQYRPAVFKHGQRPPRSNAKVHPDKSADVHHGVEGHLSADDHFSPVRASEYLEMRLRPRLAWYRMRIPSRSRMRLFLKLLMLLATVATSVLARYGFGHWVAIVASFSSFITSWSEFSDHGRKVERYNRVIGSAENLLAWWESMRAVDKASAASISHLIQTGETILSTERLAWQSTAGRGAAHDADNAPEEENEAGQGKGKVKGRTSESKSEA